MGEARRRTEKGLQPRGDKKKANDTSRIFSWFSNAKTKREQFYEVTQAGAWIGIGLLVGLWLVVRFVGPAAGWWVLSDS